jgi:glyoxylate carboligase
MRAIDAAAEVLRREGVSKVFGVPGAAINPFYSAMKKNGGFSHVLARHVEAASHMAEGYTRARAGNIGVCIGTSGPAGTDMITGLYSAWADSIPILCITGQAPRARLYKEDFPGGRYRIDCQAGHQMGGHGPRTGPGAACVPAGLPHHALRPARTSAHRPAV